MVLHLGEIAVIADMVANAISIHIGIDLLSPTELFNQSERLKNGAGIFFSAPQVIDLAATGCGVEGVDKAGHIFGMDIVANLLSLVAKNPVLAPFHVAFRQVAEKTVQFNAGMVRSRQQPPRRQQVGILK